MFQNSVSIDSQLNEDVARIEAKVPGYRVLGADFYAYPIITFSLNCTVRFPRKLTLIEEFILRGAIDFKEAAITWIELAQLLAVDKKFIYVTVLELIKLDALQSPASGLKDPNIDFVLKVTKKGETFYTKQQIPHTESRQLYMFYDTLSEKFISAGKLNTLNKATHNVKPLRSLSAGSSTVPNLQGQLTKELLIEVTSATDNPLENKVEDRRLESFEIITSDQENALLALYVIWDMVDEKLFVRIENKTLHTSHDYEGANLDIWLKRFKIKVEDIIQSRNGELDNIPLGFAKKEAPPSENRRSIIEPLIYNNLIQARGKGGDRSSVDGSEMARLVFDKDLQATFLNTLMQAQKRVVVISPWISEQVLDDTFTEIVKALASRSIITIIGWGYSKRIELEEKRPPKTLTNKLNGIKTPDGLQAVSMVWLGNQYSKDVVVDNSSHLHSYFNLIPYKGIYLPCKETVYSVSNPETVSRVSSIIDDLFAIRLQEQWNTYIKQNREGIPYSLLTTYIGIGHLATLIDFLCDDTKDIQSQFLIIVYLLNTLSWRIWHVTIMNIIALVARLGKLLENTTLLVSKENAVNLRESIVRLIKETYEFEPVNLFKVLSTYQTSWSRIGIIGQSDTVENLILSLNLNAPGNIKSFSSDKSDLEKGK